MCCLTHKTAHRMDNRLLHITVQRPFYQERGLIRMADRYTVDHLYSKTPRDLGLYVHIPFCVRKCNYCDFLSAPAAGEVQRQYTEAVITDIESYRGKAECYRVPSIFFGGGTPSCIDAEYIKRIMEALFSVFYIDGDRLEATIEVNPGTVTEDKLLTYRAAGFNRLSFGLQSADNHELKLLGRIHTYEEFEDNYKAAREAGFNNINIDLMSALPRQTLQSWEYTLNKVLDLEPEHISAYSLIIEEGTDFYECYREGAERHHELPDEETDRKMYQHTKEILRSRGYRQYEISNYARNGYQCAHNCNYWNGTEYLGFGIGAASLLNGARFSKLQNIAHYIQKCALMKYNALSDDDTAKKEAGCADIDIKSEASGTDRSIIDNYDTLSVAQRMEEFMFLGLRRCEGISKSAFLRRFGIAAETVYQSVLKDLTGKKLMEDKGDRLRLTDYGMDISNTVLCEFLMDITQ